MKNKEEKEKEEILDLQVFLTRTPGTQSLESEELPSFIISGGERRSFSYYKGSEPDFEKEQQTYIAVANSSVVEVIKFPFEPKTVLDMMRKLDFNEARLLECMKFGTQLFNFAIHGSIRDLFRNLNNQGKTLRLTIATSIPELAILPWELMCDTKSGSYPKLLCFQPNIRFCRALHIFDRANFELKRHLGENNKIRILLVTSLPESAGYLNLFKEELLLKTIIDTPPILDSILLDIIHDANTNILREKLLKFKPHILHLSCHGGYDTKEKLGFVALVSPHNPHEVDYVNSYRLTSIIEEAESVQLAFISTCYGSKGYDGSAFSGVAQLLHASGINDVVSLNFSVLDKTGHAILANFYKYLLRDGLTVEESISKVRKFLFINGYSLEESFGLTLYQANASLYREGASGILTDSGEEFDRNAKAAEELIERNNLFNMKVAELFKLNEIEDILKKLKLSTLEMYLTVCVFGNKPSIAVEIIYNVQQLGIEKQLFLEIAEIAKKLSLAPHEGKNLATTFILKANDIKSDDDDNNQYSFIENLTPNLFFESELKEIISIALTVNGEDKAFIIISSKDKRKHHQSFICDLNKIKYENNDIEYIGNDKWHKICYLVREAGLALILPGNQRVKLIVKGCQIAEFRSGEWKLINFRKMSLTITQISQKLKLEERLLHDVLKKCIYASDIGNGLTFIIQRQDNILERCHSGYRKPKDLEEKKIMEFKSEEYLNRSARVDNAIILSEDGYTIAIGAPLKPKDTTVVQGIPGTGSRHLSAQRMTKETDSIAFVVSDDGPITIFFEGKVEFRTP